MHQCHFPLKEVHRSAGSSCTFLAGENQKFLGFFFCFFSKLMFSELFMHKMIYLEGETLTLTQ